MVFKKHISLLLGFFLLVFYSGLAFNVHFCEGKIASVTSVFSKEEVCEVPVKIEESCCSKPDQSHKNCCTDKEINLKNKPEKVIVKSIVFDIDAIFIYSSISSIVFPNQVETAVSQKLDFYCDANAPPLYQLYCQYTLYA